MPRSATADGEGTNDAAQAQKGPDGPPVNNAARDIWVTETALTAALDTSHFAENVSMFVIIDGSRCVPGRVSDERPGTVMRGTERERSGVRSEPAGDRPRRASGGAGRSLAGWRPSTTA